VKYSKQAVLARFHKIPRLRFEDQRLTSFGGVIVFQVLFQKLNLKARLKQCFQPVKGSAIFGPHRIVLLLIVHLLLGFRRLRDVDYYRDDPLVQRLLGLHRLPDVATICRTLAAMGRESVQKVRQLSSALVLDALRREGFSRLTLDFDGSVTFHPRPRRRYRSRLQHPEEGGAQLLQPVLHGGAERAIPRCPSPSRQCP